MYPFIYPHRSNSSSESEGQEEIYPSSVASFLLGAKVTYEEKDSSNEFIEIEGIFVGITGRGNEVLILVEDKLKMIFYSSIKFKLKKK